MDSNNNEIDDRNVKVLNISESIRCANQYFDEVLETNCLDKVLDKIETNCDKCIYHSFLRSVYLIFIAILTMEESDIESANHSVNDLSKLCNKFRRNGFLFNTIKIFKTPDYENYTDLEAHSEFIYACSLSMSAIVSGLFKSYSIYGLIRAVYRLQKFFKTFSSAKIINKKKNQWENDESKLFLDAGIHLANGICHLAISNVPPKILKIANFLGYRGIESNGFKHLNKSAFELPGLFSFMSRIFLMGYWCYVETHLLLGPNNVDISSKIIKIELDQFPKSILMKTLAAKLEQIRGNIDSAIDLYKDLLKLGGVKGHRIYHYELVTCSMLKSDWDQGIKYWTLLREGCFESSAFTTYIGAVFCYSKYVSENDIQMKQKATELFNIIPGLRIRHLGKTMSHEKVAVLNSEKYLKCNEFLIFPELELMYQFNLFLLIKDNKTLLNRILIRIEIQMESFKKELEKTDYMDNHLSALFYKGVVNKYLGQVSIAKECFNTILNDDSKFEKEFSMAPQAVLEMGLVDILINNPEGAEQWLNKCINDYHGYQNENFVHLKAYSALRLLGFSGNTHKKDETELEKYTEDWLKQMKIDKEQLKKINKLDII